MYAFRRKPLRHQYRALKKLLQLDGCGALYAERGTGKTKVVVDLVGVLQDREGVCRVLVVAPLNALRVWKDEIETDLNVTYSVIIYDSWAVPTIYCYTENAAVEIHVMTYTMATLHSKELLAQRFDVVVADESHHIRNMTKRSRTLWKLGRLATYRIALSGTPAPKWPLDYWSQFQFFRPGVLPPTYGQMKQRYARFDFWGYEVREWLNQEELEQIVKDYSFRVTKAEALDLPPQIEQIVHVRLGDEAMRLLRDLKQQMIAEYQGHAIITENVLVQILRSQQICGGFLNDNNCVDSAKINVAEELIQELVAEGKNVVVFCRFLAELRSLDGAMLHYAIPRRIIHGGTSRKARTEAQDWFQEGGGRVLIAQIQAGSEAVTLTAAHHTIFYSLDWQSEHYIQAMDRTHRIGQTETCIYYILLAEGTIDERVYGAVKSKDKDMRWLLGWLNDQEN